MRGFNLSSSTEKGRHRPARSSVPDLRLAKKANPGGRRRPTALPSRLLLHVLDAGENDAFGALLGIAEIDLVSGEEHRIAVDVVGNAGAVGGDERLELLAIVGRNPPRQLKLADFEFHRQRVFG